MLRVPEMDSEGHVRLTQRNISVSIPKGIVPGQFIRIRGDTVGGGMVGDLILEVAFAPHPIFRLDGRDLYLDLPVTPWEAALGAKVRMPTPGGMVDIRVPRNARAGQKLRLRGRGLPGAQPGDLFAVIKIVNPPVETPAAREFYERMAREMSFNPRESIGG